MKQSGATINGNPTNITSNLGAHNDNTRRLNFYDMDSNENSKNVGHRGRKTIHGGRQRTPNYLPPQPQSRPMRNWIANKRWYSNGRSSVSMLLPESVARYTEMYNTDLNRKSTGGGANNKL